MSIFILIRGINETRNSQALKKLFFVFFSEFFVANIAVLKVTPCEY